MSIAFIDIDRTLLSVNSGTLWVRRERELGFLSLSQALRAAVWIGRYHLGFAAPEQTIGVAIRSLEGVPVGPFAARAAAFYADCVQPNIRPGARAAIETHRARGDALVLLTSSSNYVADPLVTELRLDGALCNRLEVGPDGRHTGRPTGRVCFGEGKLDHAAAEAKRRGVSLRDCTFYTDSFSDAPVLEVVGQPVAVNPDPRLRRLARRRGWRMVDWGEPRKPFHAT